MCDSTQGNRCNTTSSDVDAATANGPCKIYCISVLALLAISIWASGSTLYFRYRRSFNRVPEAPSQLVEETELKKSR